MNMFSCTPGSYRMWSCARKHSSHTLPEHPQTCSFPVKMGMNSKIQHVCAVNFLTAGQYYMLKNVKKKKEKSRRFVFAVTSLMLQ